MRQYLIGSWANADEYDYSGEQLMGNRLGASRDASHFNKDGSANVSKYGDNTAPEKRKTSIPLVDRILPQMKRVNTLTDQLIELEAEYKSGKMEISEYSLLRDVLCSKRSRAQELLKKAVSVKKPEPTPSDDEDSYDYDEQYAEYGGENTAQNGVGDESAPEWLKTVSDQNSVKKVIVKGCRAWKKAVELSHKAAHYYSTLKAL